LSPLQDEEGIKTPIVSPTPIASPTQIASPHTEG
jgi:hypothetical protein